MSTTRDVDLGGVHVTGSWSAPGGTVEAQLAVYTKSGQARIAVVDERQLIRLIGEAAEALQKLRTHRECTDDAARDVARHHGYDDSPRAMLDERQACPFPKCVKLQGHTGPHAKAYV